MRIFTPSLVSFPLKTSVWAALAFGLFFEVFKPFINMNNMPPTMRTKIKASQARIRFTRIFLCRFSFLGLGIFSTTLSAALVGMCSDLARLLRRLLSGY